MSPVRLTRLQQIRPAITNAFALFMLFAAISGAEARQQPSDFARPAEIMVARQCAYQTVKRVDTPTMPVATLTRAIIDACRPEILAALDEMDARPEVTQTDVARFRRNNLDNPDLDALVGQLIETFREELKGE